MSEKEFVVVSTDVLPEVVTKVIDAKRLLAQGVCHTSTEACREAGVSRSAYYKYKDSAFIYSEKMNERIVTFCLVLSDRAGILAEVLNEIYRLDANILTINQNIPIDSAATVMITVRLNDLSIEPGGIIKTLSKISGVASVKIISGK